MTNGSHTDDTSGQSRASTRSTDPSGADAQASKRGSSNKSWLVTAAWVSGLIGLAVLWWHFADSSGWTKKREMNKMEQRKTDRRERAMEALGIGKRRDRIAAKASEAKARQVSADPTHAGRDAPSKPVAPPEPPRRDPRP